MRWKTALFDLDGTLVLSSDAHARAWTRAFGQQGVRIPFEEVRGLIGMGGDKIIDLVAPKMREADRQQLKARRKDLFLTTYIADVRPAPRARELVDTLAASGLRTVLATSAEADEVDVLLRVGDLQGCFHETVTATHARRGKPDPDIVTAALERSNTPAPQAVMIGDTPYDIKAARGAGVACIAVRTGGWPDAALRDALAVFDDVADLLQRYEDSPLGTQLARDGLLS